MMTQRLNSAAETIRFTFSIEEAKLKEFIAWCKRNKVSAAQVLRMYVEKELAAK
jgi:hypothetical protein